MRNAICAAVVVLSMACAPTGWAQTAAPPPEPSKRQLVLEYVEIMNMNKMMENMGRSMVDSMLASSTLPPEVAKALRDSAGESIAAIYPRMLDRIVDLYAEALTVEELKALIAFYGSPMGKGLLAKTEKLMAATTPLVQEFGPIMQRDMLTRMCTKVECPSEFKDRIERMSKPA
jgi:hypothetical protein